MHKRAFKLGIALLCFAVYVGILSAQDTSRSTQKPASENQSPAAAVSAKAIALPHQLEKCSATSVTGDDTCSGGHACSGSGGSSVCCGQRQTCCVDEKGNPYCGESRCPNAASAELASKAPASQEVKLSVKK